MKECIVLAGGIGSRLSAVTSDEPKCLVKILNKPFISYLFDYLLREGFEHVVLSLGYGATKISKWLEVNRYPIEITVVVEKEQLGTGGAIKNAISAIKGDSFFVMNGDTLFKVNTEEMKLLHIQNNADITIALKPMKNIERYGSVTLDANNRIIRFKEKETIEEGLINGGIYILNESLFKNTTMDIFSFEKEILEYTDKYKIFGHIDDSYFIDIGTPEDYQKANMDFLNF